MQLTASEIAKYATQVKQLHDEIHRTCIFRDSGKKEFYLEYKNAINNWHQHRSPLEKFWTDSFKSLVQSGDRVAINELITFLEVDPYYFRSGYLKGRLARYMKNTPRTQEDNHRLRGVIWNRARGPRRNEFREYCRLATLISTPFFREKVAQSADNYRSNNFNFLLPYLPEDPQSLIIDPKAGAFGYHQSKHFKK